MDVVFNGFFFAFSEQTVDSLNLNHSPDLLFLMTDKFYRMLRIFSYVARMVGDCFE
jgi:hypothetical protein